MAGEQKSEIVTVPNKKGKMVQIDLSRLSPEKRDEVASKMAPVSQPVAPTPGPEPMPVPAPSLAHDNRMPESQGWANKMLSTPTANLQPVIAPNAVGKFNSVADEAMYDKQHPAAEVVPQLSEEEQMYADSQAALKRQQEAQGAQGAQTPQGAAQPVQQPVFSQARIKGAGPSPATLEYQHNILKSMGAQGDAAAAQSVAQAEGAENAGLFYEQAQDELLANQQKNDPAFQAANKAYAETIAKHDAALEEVRKTNITEGKEFRGADGVLAAIGMLMVGGPQLLVNMMDRSVQLQTANLKKQQEYVDGLRISAGMKAQMLNQLRSEEGIERSKILEATKLKLETVAARTNNQVFKAKAAETIGMLDQQLEQNKAAFARQNAKEAATRVQDYWNSPLGRIAVSPSQMVKLAQGEQAHQYKMEEEGAKAKADKEELTIPGYAGHAKNPTAYGKAVEIENGRQGMNEAANKWRELREKYKNGGWKDPNVRAQIKGLYEDMLLSYAKVKTGGVVTESDKANARSVVPSPSDWFGGQAKMDQLFEMTNRLADKQMSTFDLRRENAPTEGARRGL